MPLRMFGLTARIGIAATALAITSVCAAIGVVVTRQYSHSIQTESSFLAEDARDAAKRLDSALSNTMLRLLVDFQTPAFQQFLSSNSAKDQNTARTTLIKIFRRNADIYLSGFFLANNQGQILVDVGNPNPQPNNNIHQFAHSAQCLDVKETSHQKYITTPIIPLTDKKLGFLFCAPIKKENRQIGILAASFNLNALLLIQEKSFVPEKQSYLHFVLDEQNREISQLTKNANTSPLPEVCQFQTLSGIVSGHKLFCLGPKFLGTPHTKYLIQSSNLSSQQWKVLTLRPIQTITDSLVDEAVISLSLALLTLLILSFPMVFFLNTAILRPIRNITTQVQRLSNLEFDNTLPSLHSDELGDLECAFQKMHVRITSTIQMLRQINSDHDTENKQQQLVSNITHEMRTPLTAIIGYLDLILAKDGEQLSQFSKKAVNIVKQNSNHLLALINNILDLSSIEAKQVHLDITFCDCGLLLNQIFDSMFIEAKNRNLDITLNIQQPFPPIFTDETRLRQILFNIVGNAIKYTHEGKVSIRARIASATPRLKAHMRIEIKDTGPGIKPHDQERLFEPFVRVETPKGVHGSGLGLFITKKLLELLGGHIELESDGFSGTTFTVILPLNRSPE